MTDYQTPPPENGGTIQQDKTNIKKPKPYTGYKTRIVLVLPNVKLQKP